MPRHPRRTLTSKKILDSQMDFRNDENLWWQVAEYSYETFMIRTRTKAETQEPIDVRDAGDHAQASWPCRCRMAWVADTVHPSER